MKRAYLEHVQDHHRFKHVQLEIAVRSRESYGGVVTNDLSAHHFGCLYLRRVHLTRHDRRPGLVRGDAVAHLHTPHARTHAHTRMV